MVEEKFNHLEQRILKLIEKNNLLTERVSNTEKERDGLKSDLFEMQKEFDQESDELNRKNDLLTDKLKKIMNRLESLSKQAQ